MRDAVSGAAGEALRRFTAGTEPAEALAAWFGDAPLTAALRKGRQGLRHIVDRDIADLDGLITAQLDLILAHPDLQRLESAWRGVSYLLETADDDPRVKVRILPITWTELARDFDKVLEFDQSTLFDKVYNEEFGMPGGLPFGLLICDHAVRHKRDAAYRVDDVGVLAGLSQVAAAAFVPCLVGAAPQLLGVENYADLAIAQDLTSVFRSAEYQRWQTLQHRDDSRFLGVVLPRVLLRAAWGDDGGRRDGFRYHEGAHGHDTGTWLWGNGAYAVGAVSIRAFRDWGWFADIRGTRMDLEEAGLITGLPNPAFSTGESEAYRRPIEVEFTDRKQRALEDAGLIALSPCRMTEYLALLGAPSLRVPEGALNPVVDANERLSAMLHYVLCASRFAHYIKVIVRDRVGALITSNDLEHELQTWLDRYVTGNPEASFSTKARYPLNAGQVSVSEIPGRPGSFTSVIHITPHFQVDQMVAAFRFQTEIRATRAA
ncbi:type VI secretion system contractile sheath large subunit [Methylobacterium sp. E-016]|uniref:type VI secretion system contractile sheath large subunit n=1 Tax=Methylobacterium sp. E-016 TaxID=2836556 RepID=UPI001FB9872C|nr:type VI secretion system contractile sheath large subunit [Methylobacterium sp. E-016]MCJ2077084.1 type VI secretion system contractile sheath large subunit [Methylobacterium sp. E-016]